MKKCTHSREIVKCGDSVVPYYKGLLLKQSIRSLWEQIFSFKWSHHFEKEPNCSFQLSPFDVRK